MQPFPKITKKEQIKLLKKVFNTKKSNINSVILNAYPKLMHRPSDELKYLLALQHKIRLEEIKLPSAMLCRINQKIKRMAGNANSNRGC